jgi:hypothetical protein
VNELRNSLFIILTVASIISCKQKDSGKPKDQAISPKFDYAKYEGEYKGYYFSLLTDSPYGIKKEPCTAVIAADTLKGGGLELRFMDSAHFSYPNKIRFTDSNSGYFPDWPRRSSLIFNNDTMLFVDLCQTPSNTRFYWWECGKVK